MKYKITWLLFSFLFYCSVANASSGCSCSGHARVVERINLPSTYSESLRDSERDKFERVLQIEKAGLQCKGHGCCVSPEVLLFTQIRKPKDIRYVSFKGESNELFNLMEAERVRFEYSCNDSMGPNGGSVGSYTLKFVESITNQGTGTLTRPSTRSR